MTAQYRPYRDEEGSDEGVDREHLTNWASSSDNDGPGSIQIYEKTTEDLPFVATRQRFFMTSACIIVTSLLIGFFLGLLSSPSSSKYTADSFCSSAFYHASHRDADLSVRDKIIQLVDPEEMLDLIKDLSKSPRLPSTSADVQSVGRVVEYFKSHALDSVIIKNYTVLLSLPNETNPNTVQVVDKSTGRVAISTSSNDTHSSSSHSNSEFIAYSPAADVTGELVYINYGHASDYETLKELEIPVKGNILLAKQQNLAADEQLRLAQESGAIALLLYPDASEGGSFIPEDAVRRDSLLWNGQGDPQTPGYPSTPFAYRIPVEDLKDLPKIPVQSISLSTAIQLIFLLGGKNAPDAWNGHSHNSSFDYHLGPGFRNSEYRLRVKTTNILKQTTIQNVIGTIQGSIEPDRYVIVGNHRDSWVSGAIDSAGGMAGLFQLVKIFGGLKVDHGWRPRRSIIFCSWGAEEFNLMGSTEWIEENIKLIMSRAVAYVNMDILAVGNGSVSVASSPLLFQSIYNATKQVEYPDNSGSTLYDTWISAFPIYRNKSQLILSSSSSSPGDHTSLAIDETVEWSKAAEFPVESSTLLSSFVTAASVRLRPKVRQLDTRSVYAPFFIRAGIPAVEVTFVPTATDRDAASETYPLIHTQYDTIDLLKKFDKDLKFHRAVTQVAGEIIRNLADSTFIPFNLLEYCQVLYDYYLALESHSDLFSSHGLNFSLLESAIKNFTRSALTFHAHMESIDGRDVLSIRRINDQLLMLERMFLDPHGLPRNPSKKHVLLSPSEAASAGIIDEMFPGLMDELSLLALLDFVHSEWSWDVVRAHFSVIVYTIQSAADFLSTDGLM